MKTIEYGINLGIAGDWVALVEYTIDDDDYVEIVNIKIKPDAANPFQYSLLDILKDELENSSKFLNKVLES